jgi:predicted DCC family thiol-disulfide oxidoreductase YuxK
MNELTSLTVLYDDACGFCCECAAWFAQQGHELQTTFVPRFSEQGQLLMGVVKSTRAAQGRTPIEDELLVLDDRGGVYEGPQAFILCLWALTEYRDWSVRLATPRLMPLARRFFIGLSKNRKMLSAVLGLHGDRIDEETLVRALPHEPTRCAG